MYDLLRDSALLAQNKTLANLYELTCAHGDATAAIWLENGEEKRLSYEQYSALCDDYAAYFLQALPKGGYVAISMDTCKEWFPTLWGLLRSGHDALLLDPSLDDSMTAFLMAQAGCKAMITTKERKLGNNVLQLRAPITPPKAKAYKAIWGENVALCTSGTTGVSRVFTYNASALCEQVLSSELLFRQNRRCVDNTNRRSLVFLPYHHVLGLVANLLWCGFIGYANIYLANRAPKTILETAQICKPELLVAVPLLANNLCASLRKTLAKQSPLKRAAFSAMEGLSLAVQSVAPNLGLKLAEKTLFRGVLKQMLGVDMKCVILGGSHTPPEQLRMLNALGYYTVCGFGMTETAITSLETSMNLRKRLSGSVGRPLSNVQYRVRAGADSRRGEMLIKGQSIHTGRMADGKALPPELLEGGWYPTGDIVRLEKGDRMFVEGRCKDVIINESGENVYPDELEDLFSGLRGVEQMTILGVKKPGKHQHYEDITLIMNVGEHYRDDAFLLGLVKQLAQVNRGLPVVKRVTRALVTPDKLPLVNGIKVKRVELKRRAEENKLAYRELSLNPKEPEPVPVQESLGAKDVKPTDLAMEEIRQKVRQLYAETLQVEPESIADNAHFIDDLGGDSLQVLSISLKVEELFSVLIPVEEYGRCATVSDLSALVYDHVTGNTAYETQHAAPTGEVTPITRFEDTPEFQAFQKRQQALMASGDSNPYFVCHDSPLRDTSLMAGHEVLNFGSYNYVGMSGRSEVQEAAKAAIDKYGTSASGSRLLAGEKSLYQELEKEIADWKHAESALVCVGGHSTNVTFVGNFCGKNDLIVYDALAHNSIEQGCKLSQAVAKPFPHNDAAALESILRTQRKHFEKVLIVIEGAYSMDGDIANVPAFVKLKKEYGCFLMVDEAHSACVIGETGGGVDEYFHLEPTDIDVKMGTLSKGLGTCGGYLAGRKCLIEYLRYNLPGFVFSVGISPALAAGTLCAVRLLRNEPGIMAEMRRNIKCFADGARKRGFDICLAGETAVIPVLVGRDEDAFLLSNELRKRGVFVPPAVYPAVPKNKARLRFCVISEHKPEQIERALDILSETADALGIVLPKRVYG